MMQLLQHEQMWALSRNIQIELLREAEKARLLRRTQSRTKPWWSSLIQRWLTRERIVFKRSATLELG